MTDRRHFLAFVAGAALILAGCAGSPAQPIPSPASTTLAEYDPATDGNGVALLSPEAARDAALDAMRHARGASVRGTYRDAASGRILSISGAGSPERYRAEITVDGDTTSIVVDGGQAWVNPSPAIAGSTGLRAGAWACVSSTDPLVTRWMPLLQPADLVADLTADAAGLSAPGESTVDILLGAEGTSGVLTVSTTGRPLPTRLVRADATGTAEVSFTDWGVEPDLTPPADC